MTRGTRQRPVRRRRGGGLSRMIGRWPDGVRFEDAEAPLERLLPAAGRDAAVAPQRSRGPAGRSNSGGEHPKPEVEEMASKPKEPNGRRGSRCAGAMAAGTAAIPDLRKVARDAALSALKRLADLSRSEDERVALAASQELLNRALGRSAPAGTEDRPVQQPLIIRIVRFGEPERRSDTKASKHDRA